MSKSCLIVLWLVVFAGCRAQQLQSDQADARATILALYEDQLMDNLIRAANDLPIIQIDYTNVTGTITHVGSVTGGATQTNVDNRAFHRPSDAPISNYAFPTERALTNVYNLSGTGSQTNQLTMTANPVINNNAIYDAYLEFLSKGGLRADINDPRGRKVQLTADERPHVGLVRRWPRDRKYYWIPESSARAFLKLSLVTTAQRGERASRPLYFEAIVQSVVRSQRIAGTTTGYRVVLRLDKPIPVDSGRLTVTLKGKEETFHIERASQDEDGKPIDLTKPTSLIPIIYDESEEPKLSLAEFTDAIKGQPARIRLENVVPGDAKTDQLIDAIKELTNEQRLQRLNESP